MVEVEVKSISEDPEGRKPKGWRGLFKFFETFIIRSYLFHIYFFLTLDIARREWDCQAQVKWVFGMSVQIFFCVTDGAEACPGVKKRQKA